NDLKIILDPDKHVLFLLDFCIVQSEPRCDQTEFLHHNGTCVACPVCQPGEQLSGDCGFGDGGDGVCIPCEEGTFSTDTGVDPCRRCTQCNLLNRLVLTACSPTSNAVCGQCLPGSSPEDTTRYVFCEFRNKEQHFKHFYHLCFFCISNHLYAQRAELTEP
uniref:TNFR-Cys domain-containing protein n=1 Tax=Fundulus heteroclitus TaxID=8078 RepID=A0A3Q2PNT9_FUNHE